MLTRSNECFVMAILNKYFTNTSPEILGTHLIDHERMKVWVDLGAAK